eukprot:766323-Pelagomonas_calceolata.AAC.1
MVEKQGAWESKGGTKESSGILVLIHCLLNSVRPKAVVLDFCSSHWFPALVSAPLQASRRGSNKISSDGRTCNQL